MPATRFRCSRSPTRPLALTLNEVQTQSIAHAGQRDIYTFTLGETKIVYFDSQTTSSGYDSYYLRWSLSGPQGVLASNQPFRGSDSYDGTVDLRAAAGRLHADGAGGDQASADITGDYAFRLLDLSRRAVAGDRHAGQTACSTRPARPTPTASAPRPATASSSTARATAAATPTGGCSTPGARPSGDRPRFGNDVDVTTLPFDGIYTLLIEGRYYVGGQASYGFNVSPSPLQAPIVIDGLGRWPGPT